MACVDAGALHVGESDLGAIGGDLVLKTTKSALWQSFGACEPLNKLGSEGWFHLNNESEEVIVATAICVKAMVGLDYLLELAEVFPFTLVHHLTADHVLNFTLR